MSADNPTVTDAVQWTGKNLEEIKAFTSDLPGCGKTQDGIIVIPTPGGNRGASIGDWILKWMNGEFSTCPPDVFNLLKTLEVVTTPRGHKQKGRKK